MGSGASVGAINSISATNQSSKALCCCTGSNNLISSCLWLLFSDNKLETQRALLLSDMWHNSILSVYSSFILPLSLCSALTLSRNDQGGGSHVLYILYYRKTSTSYPHPVPIYELSENYLFALIHSCFSIP